MSSGTKKAGSTGRLGAKYGVSVRRKIGEVEKRQKKNHECPQCTHVKVKRVSTGIYECRHCDYKFASGAYYPTIAGEN